MRITAAIGCRSGLMREREVHVVIAEDTVVVRRADVAFVVVVLRDAIDDVVVAAEGRIAVRPGRAQDPVRGLAVLADRDALRGLPGRAAIAPLARSHVLVAGRLVIVVLGTVVNGRR